jgi:hypothetical protein
MANMFRRAPPRAAADSALHIKSEADDDVHMVEAWFVLVVVGTHTDVQHSHAFFNSYV